jgi:Family of unknown function (DUF6174)
MKKLLLLFLIVVLTACSVGGSELSRNQQKWQDANIQHYRFSLNIGCFCAFRDQMPLTIEVLNGEIVSLTNAEGDSIDSTDSNYEYYARYLTIDRLFSELEAVLAGEADEVTVTYDSTYDFPAQISIDYIKEAADDELGLSVSGFEALP